MTSKHHARAAICASLALIGGTGWAQNPAPEQPAASAAAANAVPTERLADKTPPGAPTQKGEPNVKYTVIEDEGARIDELRVRGQTQRITVTPKVGGKVLAGRPYEILSPAGSQDLQEAPNGVRGAAGKRVWHILSF